MARLDELRAEKRKRELIAERDRRQSLVAQVPEDIGNIQAGLIGTGRGFTNIGRGAQNLISLVTGDDEGISARKELSRQESETLEPLTEKFPISTTIGEVIGESAALPVGGFGKSIVTRALSSAGAGGLAGGISESGRGGEDVGAVAAISAALGPVGEAIGSLIGRFGAPAVDKAKKLLRARGVLDEITPDRLPEILDRLDISPEEFQSTFKDVAKLSDGLTPDEALRSARAGQQGVSLTKGQSSREFAAQSAEDTLKGLEGEQGQRARRVFSDQQQELISATERFKTSLGGQIDATRSARGETVKATFRELDAAQKLNVSNLYEELAGIEGGNVRINGKQLTDSADELIREIVPSDRIQKGLDNIFNDFELLEESVKTKTSQGPLTFKNAEKFRKRLNRLNPDSPSDIGVISQLKTDFDALISGATEQFPENTPIAEAAKRARDAAAERFDTFKAKDIVEDLISFKKGTKTDRIDSSVALDALLVGKNKVNNLKRARQVLLSGNTPQGKQAWKEIQAQGVIDLFDKAITETPDITGSGLPVFVISGAKLNSAINKMGPEALNTLLSDTQRKTLKQIQNIVSDATIPVPRTTNPSGTAGKLINAAGRMFSASQGGLFDRITSLVGASASAIKETAERDLILKGIERGATPIQKTDALLSLVSRLGTSRGLTEELRPEDER